MPDVFHVQGGAPLFGSATVGGAKNAALPIMAAAILSDAPVRLVGVPKLRDVDTLSLVLGHLGVAVKRQMNDDLLLETVDPRPFHADYELVSRMRASFCVLGPLLAKRGRGVVALPGGCDIGQRPVDLHLTGLAALGAEIGVRHGYVVASARRLRGAKVHMTGPSGPTVTGTANVLTAAVLARGVTTITGAALEPEIVDLGQFLIEMGARIDGLGTSTITVEGVECLRGATYRIIPDRIEAATLLAAGAITGGRVTICGARAEHLEQVLGCLTAMGATIDVGDGEITLAAPDRLRAIHFTALPYPGVATDVQSQLMALAALAEGTSVIRDAVFPERLRHVAELNRLGADIVCDGSTAIVRGVSQLTGADVIAKDLRASAALVLAGLAAAGETVIHRVAHLDRGYERLDGKLIGLAARIARNDGDASINAGPAFPLRCGVAA